MRPSPIGVCVLSPHLGLLDSWLPVLWELKRRHAGLTLLAVVSSEQRLLDVVAGDFLVDCSNGLFDRVLCRIGKNRYRVYSSLGNEAVAAGTEGNLAAPKEGSLATTSGNLPISGEISLPELRERVRLVCFDVAARGKTVVDEISRTFASAKFFSLPHGIDFRLTRSGRHSEGPDKGDPALQPKCVAYVLSAREIQTYCDEYGLHADDIKVVGVTRHASKWIKRVRGSRRSEEKPKGRYIFLASRPSNNPNIFPPEQKRHALVAIRQLAEELDCKIIIRRHPKERGEGVFEEVFETSRQDTNWSYSSLHPFVLGEDALFCITFFSSIAVDMAVLGTPAVEFCDFRGLPGGRQLLLDDDGQLISFYQKFGLALGARNYEELKLRVAEILSDRAAVTERLAAAQRSLYAQVDDSIDMVADDIERIALMSDCVGAFANLPGRDSGHVTWPS